MNLSGRGVEQILLSGIEPPSEFDIRSSSSGLIREDCTYLR